MTTSAASSTGVRRLLVGSVLVVLGVLVALGSAAAPQDGDVTGGRIGVVATTGSCGDQGEPAKDQERLDARCTASARRQLVVTAGPGLAAAAAGAVLVVAGGRARRRG